MSSNSSDYSHLIELGKSNYEIATGESDIRNWVVKNENGNILGEVQDLIFDSKAKKVVYLVLDLDRNELNLKERKVLLPVEYADINEAYKNVVYKGLMPNELAALPTYEKGKISRNSLDLTMSTFLSSMRTDATVNHGSASDSRQTEVRNVETREEAATIPEQKIQDTPVSNNDTFYTVIGAFDQPRQLQSVVEYLLNHGFRRDEITISTRHEDFEHEQHNRGESEITHFFKALFNNDEEARQYSEAAARGSVVTVDVNSARQAEEAAKILDKHGSVDMSAGRLANMSTSDSKTGHSRIFERRIGR